MSHAGRGRWVLAVTVALVLAACGQASPDLFAVTRSGDGPADDLTLVVNDGGTVTCNGGVPRQLGGNRLLRARELTRELAAAAELQLELPPGPRPTLFYRVESEAGTVSFSDASRNRPAALDRLVGFVSDVAENVCGIER